MSLKMSGVQNPTKVSANDDLAASVASCVRDIPDFPKPGIVFKDIAPILSDAVTFAKVIECFVERYRSQRIDAVMAVESRGFLFGAPLAFALQVPLHMVRKKGKLPFTTIEQEYALEYGTATVAVHTDAVRAGERVVIIDDLLATGGTVEAASMLVQQLGGLVAECAFVIELAFLRGRERLAQQNIFSIVRYE